MAEKTTTQKSQAEIDAEAADAAAKKAAADAEAAAQGELAKIKHVVLQSVYGFYDEAGTFFGWIEGQVVTELDHIKALIERKAPIEVVKHE